VVTFVKKGTRFVSKKTLRGIEKRRYEIRHPPKYVFDDEWKTLIVLDACRYDVWREVAAEYEFLESAKWDRSVHSPASSSREWMQANFRDRYDDVMGETAYVTANPFTQDYADEKRFASLDEVWRYGWDDELGVVPPDVVTDRAISVARASEAERTLVHYMQPHFPSLRQPELGSKINPENNNWITSVWDKLEEGTIDYDTVWQAYRDNLRDVLRSVETLLRNHDAEKVIITADHGNGFGEEGIYGHPGNRTHRVLREVPYCVTEAIDEGIYKPEYSMPDNGGMNSEVDKRLAALGYLNK